MQEITIYIDDEDLFALANWSLLESRYNISFTSNKRYVDVLCIGIRKIIDDDFVSHFPHLRYILSPSTGIDHIKLTNSKIKIINLDPSRIEDIRASSEFAFYLIMSILRRGQKVFSGSIATEAEDLFGKTLGILGYGRIGRNVAKYSEAMGANVVWHDIKWPGRTKHDILEESDIILLSINCTENNRGYISYDDFSHMYKTPYFVNIARGFLVNEDALVDALETNKIKGAALDVVDNYNKFKSSFFADGRLIITPHVAGTTLQSRIKACNFVIGELINELSNV